jgi:hypothetical protein
MGSVSGTHRLARPFAEPIASRYRGTLPEVIGTAKPSPRSWVPYPEPIASPARFRNPLPRLAGAGVPRWG